MLRKILYFLARHLLSIPRPMAVRYNFTLGMPADNPGKIEVDLIVRPSIRKAELRATNVEISGFIVPRFHAPQHFRSSDCAVPTAPAMSLTIAHPVAPECMKGSLAALGAATTFESCALALEMLTHQSQRFTVTDLTIATGGSVSIPTDLPAVPECTETMLGMPNLTTAFEPCVLALTGCTPSAVPEVYPGPPVEISDCLDIFKVITGGRPTDGRRPIEPKGRGGRPSGPRKKTGERERVVRAKTPPRMEPEIVCWRRGRDWVVGVEFPDDMAGTPQLEVARNGATLKRGDTNAERYGLEDLTGAVTVRWLDKDLKNECMLDLGDSGYLLFKLRQRDGNFGRRVSTLSYGEYLVILPKGWRLVESQSSVPIVGPESTFHPGYLAYICRNY